MRKMWRTLSRSESKKEKQAVRAERGKPGKPVPVERFVALEPSTFRANLMEARREGYFADIILEDKTQFKCHKVILHARTKGFLSRADFQKHTVRLKELHPLALGKFLDLVYFGEVSLKRLKCNRFARQQFLDLAQAELSEVVFQLLKTAASSTTAATHWRLPIEDVVLDFERCIGAHDYHDCRVRSDDGSIRGHKERLNIVLLVCRMRMFKDVWLEQWDGEVKSPRLKSPRSPKSDPLGFDSPRVDEHVDVFDLHQYPQKFVAELMRFIYTDRVKLVKAEEIAKLFLKEAKMLAKSDLTRKVEFYLAENLSKLTLAETLKLAVDVQAKALACACYAYYTKNSKFMEKVDVSILPPEWLSLQDGASSRSDGDERKDKVIEIDASSSESWLEATSSEAGPIEASESASDGSEGDALEDVVSTSSSSDA